MSLDRQYDKLTPSERVALILRALGRNDHLDVERLHSACPGVRYAPQRDLTYTNGLRAALQVLDALAMELHPHLHLVRFLDSQAPMLEAGLEHCARHAARVFVSGYRAAGGVLEDTDDEAEPTDVERGALQALVDVHDLTDRLRGFWMQTRTRELVNVAITLKGFDHFTRTMWGMPGELAMSAQALLFVDLEAYQAELADIEVPEAQRQRVTEMFKALWRLHLPDEGVH